MRNGPWVAIAASVLLGVGPQASGSDGWITMNAGNVFSFSAPATLTKLPSRGIDSFVGSYDSEHFGLLFDYGPYSSAIREDAIDASRFTAPAKLESLTIDGRSAQILTGTSDGSGNCDLISDLFIAGPTKDENLTMTSCGDAEGIRQARRLYESIKFTKHP